MPYLRVTVTDPDLPAGTRHLLAEGLTGLAVSALGKDRARTIVQINAVEPGSYYVDGSP
ncbi:tautomerase family protein [Streptomyces endophyticus]|uniref:Tautomerase family protein n=1 Tax=Streptomyces endophyticus TaxID=714166 RepID=A0ABU6F7M1_9ACTN|nr:tautomerase family protein [Streptomyces endophyticus]MEB8339360.1 tautomerase family protein [Streptomyces endophyticus]